MHSKKEIKITCFHDYDRATVVTRHLCRHILLRFLDKLSINSKIDFRLNRNLLHASLTSSTVQGTFQKKHRFKISQSKKNFVLIVFDIFDQGKPKNELE